MTRLYVDQQEIPLPAIALDSLGALVQHVENEALGPQSLIRRILVDGAPLDLEEFCRPAGPAAMSMSGHGTIEIITGTTFEIARDAVREALAYLDRAELITPSIARSFELTPGPEAFAQLSQLLDGFRWIAMLVDRLTSLFRMELGRMRVEGKSIQEHHDGLAEVLRQLVSAQEHEDFAFIADLLEFEILPFIPVWRRVLQTLMASTP